MVTSTTPNGAKLVKFFTMLVSIYTIPSRLNRLTAVTVCSVSSIVWLSITSPVADTPSQAHRAEIRIMANVKTANRVMGWGSRLPTRSTPLRNRPNRERFSFFLDFSIHLTFLFFRRSNGYSVAHFYRKTRPR